MASRRSDSTRSTQAPPRKPVPPSAQAADSPTHSLIPSPIRTTRSAPAHEADSGATPSPAKRPARNPAKSAPRRAQQSKADPALRMDPVSDDVRRAMIAEAAYFHAERRGFGPGGEVEDWLAAEAEVDALLEHSNGMRQ